MIPDSELLRTLLRQRGLTDDALIERFLHPDYEVHTHNPLLLKDMEKAVERIGRAIHNNERVVIYSDYDTDGIPGAVVLHDTFKHLGFENFSNYIPHRNLEGFGLNTEAINLFHKEGVTLIITVDCGMGDMAHVARAKEYGIDVIITDHHLPVPSNAEGPNHTVPDAYAIVNPNQAGDTYPFKHLCGAAVAFKLAQVLLAKIPHTISPGWEKWLLDMVGIATLSDMVPLVDENRVFARYGLTVLRKSRRPGLIALLKKAGVNQRTITEDDVGFMIGPRINAASRMDVPEEAFRLLATNDQEEAERLAAHLDKVNNERKGAVAAMAKEIKHRMADLEAIPPVIVMGNTHWKPGLLGLAASAVVDTFERPVFLWGRDGREEGVIKGSCRSDGSVDVVALMHHAGEALLEYGGHKMSGGFVVSIDRIHTLQDTLAESYKAVCVKDAPALDTRNHDALLVPEEIDDAFRALSFLAPFGTGNPKPLFLFESVPLEKTEQFGKEGSHIRLVLKKRVGTVDAIQFFGTLPEHVKNKQNISLIASLEKDTFKRGTPIRLRIVDILQ